jgi:hypothetical protein
MPGIDGGTIKAIHRHSGGCGGPIPLWFLESRVRNERRMLGSGRGYGRPGVERPYGARSLLYSSTIRTILSCRFVGVLHIFLRCVDLLSSFKFQGLKKL